MASTVTTMAACLMMASQTYSVPSAVLLGIMKVEGGRIGQEVLNNNGTHDLGPMQVNTLWLPELARYWRTDVHTARRMVRDDGCVNVNVAAWILRQKIVEANGSLSGGIARYHSGTPHLGKRYLQKVTSAMQRMGLLASNTQTRVY